MNKSIWYIARLLRRIERFFAAQATSLERYVLKRQFPQDWEAVENLFNSINDTMKNGPKINLTDKK